MRVLGSDHAAESIAYYTGNMHNTAGFDTIANRYGMALEDVVVAGPSGWTHQPTDPTQRRRQSFGVRDTSSGVPWREASKPCERKAARCACS